MKHRATIPASAFLACVALLAVTDASSAQSSGAKHETAPWTDAPVRVDRKAQNYQRIEASPATPIAAANEAFPLRFDRGTYFKVVDSVSFNAGGKQYRLVDLEPVPSKKVCKNRTGERWACGLRARAALGALLQAPIMRCTDRGRSEEIILVECRRNGRDIGAALVLDGHAVVARDSGRYQPEAAEATRAKVGIWADVSPAN